MNWEQSTSLRSLSSFRISRDAGRHVTAATRIRVNGTDEVDAFKGGSRDGSARPLLSPPVTYDGDLHHRRGQVTSHSRTELMNAARRREAPPPRHPLPSPTAPGRWAPRRRAAGRTSALRSSARHTTIIGRAHSPTSLLRHGLDAPSAQSCVRRIVKLSLLLNDSRLPTGTTLLSARRCLPGRTPGGSRKGRSYQPGSESRYAHKLPLFATLLDAG